MVDSRAEDKFLDRGRDDDWWRKAVIYQIYPRSFKDSNRDGVGDLAGIIESLDYVAALGVDAIWISPFFQSPMEDFGYDVSDYRTVDPLFGDNDILHELVTRAHALGVRVLVDLVVSHTSDKHTWFVESRRTRENPKADWYVWADAKADGTPPNNWLSIFGGTAWQWDGGRRQYYLHNFLSSQPDLNFHNPAVQDAVLDIAKFWLDAGIDGFRLDTINFYFCDAKLRDNPALPEEKRNESIAPGVNPYNYQDHQHDKNQPENLDFLRRLRLLMDGYPGSMMLGEIGDAQSGLELLGEYTAGDDHVHMCYAFELLSKKRPDAQYVASVLTRLNAAAPDALACWAFSNHDVVRHGSRWQLGNDEYRLLLALILALPGAVCIYQGEELGLPEADLKFEDLRDPYGIEFWPEFKGRDGCRTPMVWRHADVNAGFSTTKPWLPIPNEHLPLAVDVQSADKDSLLNCYRKLLNRRKSLPALGGGTLVNLKTYSSALTLTLSGGDQYLHAAFNFANTIESVELPPGNWRCVDTGESQVGPIRIELDAWQARFHERLTT